MQCSLLDVCLRLARTTTAARSYILPGNIFITVTANKAPVLFPAEDRGPVWIFTEERGIIYGS